MCRCENDGTAEILDRQRLLCVAKVETDDDAFAIRCPFIDKCVALYVQQAERAAHKRRMLAPNGQQIAVEVEEAGSACSTFSLRDLYDGSTGSQGVPLVNPAFDVASH